MAGSARFGKYGDLKRKQKIRATRESLSGQGKALFASAKAGKGFSREVAKRKDFGGLRKVLNFPPARKA